MNEVEAKIISKSIVCCDSNKEWGRKKDRNGCDIDINFAHIKCGETVTRRHTIYCTFANISQDTSTYVLFKVDLIGSAHAEQIFI